MTASFASPMDVAPESIYMTLIQIHQAFSTYQRNNQTIPLQRRDRRGFRLLLARPSDQGQLFLAYDGHALALYGVRTQLILTLVYDL